MRWNVNTLDWISALLILLGAINWGLVGLFKIEIISAVFGVPVARVVFTCIGAAGLHMLYTLSELYCEEDAALEDEALAERPVD